MKTREELFNQLQMGVAGERADTSMEAVMDLFAGLIIFTAPDRSSLPAWLDVWREDLARQVDLNWDDVRPLRAQADRKGRA